MPKHTMTFTPDEHVKLRLVIDGLLDFTELSVGLRTKVSEQVIAAVPTPTAATTTNPIVGWVGRSTHQYI